MKKKQIIILLLALALSVFSLSAYAENEEDIYLTRGELCTLIAENLQLDTVNIPKESPFTDLSTTDENYAGIMACYNTGVVNGKTITSFCPNEYFTRGQIAVTIYRFAQVYDFYDENKDYSGTITDIEHVSSEFKRGIRFVVGLGAMKLNNENNFFPGEYVKAEDIDWSFSSESYVSDLGNETLRFDLADGSIRIFMDGRGRGTPLFQQSGGDVVTTSGAVIVQQSNNTIPTKNTITVENGKAMIIISDLNADNLLVEEGAGLSITLIGNNFFNSGIVVECGAELMINGSGKLTTIGADRCAGIDAYEESKVSILNGTIVTTGGRSSAGIGYGTIIIEGGNVQATAGGGGFSAGIEGENIIIKGGTVVAYGAANYVGIGGEESSITISGGIVTAIGGYHGVGIGGTHSTVYISNAEVFAEGFYCAIGDTKEGCDEIYIAPSATMHMTYTEIDAYECLEKIAIYSDPLSSAAHLNNSAKFSIDAYGFSGLSYQWQISQDGNTWIDAIGQTAATAQIPLAEENEGYYVRCKLTNGWGNTVFSNTANIYKLAFLQQPTDISTIVGGVPALSVEASCFNVTYQWQRSVDHGSTWANIPGEVYNTLILGGTLSDSGLYRCIITAANGDQLASDAATVTITDPNAPVTYKTMYYQQNADGETYTAFEQVTNSGVAGTTVTAPQKAYTHYAENTEKGTPSGNIQQDGSLVLSRYYDRASYSISFEVNGGNAIAPVSAVFGAVVSAPMQPTRMGYTFDGWYSDETLQVPYIFTVMPTENITVYAKWALIGEGRGIEYEIIGITLRDSNYQPISEIPSGQFYAEVSVTNLASTTVDTITLAAYNANGQFLSMQYLYANPAIGQTLTFGVSVDNSSGQVAKIKAFVLPALGSLVPLANSAEK